MTDPTASTGPYGRKPRSALDGYAAISYARHARDYVRGATLDEYLVEEHDDGTVTLLPNDATPYPWREIWRKVSNTRSPS